MNADALDWLLEEKDPGVRFLALRDLVALPEGDAELEAARKQALARGGAIAKTLDAMNPEGYWVKPGGGYSPKYRSIVWSIILLGQLGARAQDDTRIATACAYLLDHALAPGGQFSTSRSGAETMDCLQGNLCWSLSELGYADPRLAIAHDWMARSVTGEGIAPKEETDAPEHYFRYKMGPLFQCAVNYGFSCAWGGIKVMLGLASIPAGQRTPAIERAIAAAAEYMLDNDVANVGYIAGGGVHSKWWWNFGFPMFYTGDILQNVDALVRLGYGKDERLQPALELVRSKVDAEGRWSLDRGYSGQMWASFGTRGKPNKWVTLRALRVFKMVDA